MRREYKKLSLAHVILIVCLFAFAFSTAGTASQKDGLLKIYFLNVGQGDAEFIETPNGNKILIDGGPDATVLSKLSKIMPFYDREIDLVVLSHPHADHVTGLIEVLNRYDVANIIQARENYNSPIFLAWQEAVRNEGAENIEAVAGTKINLGNNTALTILYPSQSVANTTTGTPHDDMVMVMLEYKSFRVLFAGDTEKKVENALEQKNIDLNADVLKIGHHGSKTSSSENFLNVVKPQLGFIEVGKDNNFRLPTQEVLDRLLSHGIKYYRTDSDGTEEIVSDGENFKVAETDF